jgi:serine/threonine protein kinase
VDWWSFGILINEMLVGLPPFFIFYFYFVFQAVDWWSLGILIYEMLVGLPPFYNRNTRLAYEKVLSLLALLVLVLVNRVN